MTHNKSFIFLGGAIVVLGFLVLLELLNVVRDNFIYELLWPFMVFLTGLGLSSSKETRFYGLVVLQIGFLLLLRQLHVFDSDVGEGLLAFLLAIIGLSILMGVGDKAKH